MPGGCSYLLKLSLKVEVEMCLLTRDLIVLKSWDQTKMYSGRI